MPNKKKNIKVRDLKPSKDAKGGGGHPHAQGVHPSVQGAHPAAQGTTKVQGGGGHKHNN